MGLFGKKDKEPTIRYYTMTTTENADSQSVIEQLKISLAKSNNDYKLLYAQHQNLTEAYNELLHKKNGSNAIEVERDKYKQLYEQEKRKNANLDSVYRELQELRDFKASSKNSQQSYHDRVASLQGNHRDEINKLQGIIADLKSRVPDDPGLPSYQKLREMYNNLVREYNKLKNTEPKKEVGEIVVRSTCNKEELNRLLSEAKDADKYYLFDNPDRVNQYIKSLLNFLRMHALYDTDFLSCTNSNLRCSYAHRVMHKYEIEWHTKCRDKDIRMCMDEAWRELHAIGVARKGDVQPWGKELKWRY